MARREPTNDVIEVYPAKDGPRWRRKAKNGKIVADSAEAYSEMSEAIEAGEREAADVIPVHLLDADGDLMQVVSGVEPGGPE